MQLTWSGVTSYHDWFDERRTIPRHMLAEAKQANLIGSVEWISGSDDERKNVANSEGVLQRLLEHRPTQGDLYRIAAGGSKPFTWEMRLGLFPFRKDLGKVDGYNILNLWFESKPYEGPEDSDKLAVTFRSIHTPDDTESGFIHPYKRWSELTDTLDGRYGEPVTSGPFFSGVYWVTFLGREHLALFDLSKLRDLQTYQVEWAGDNGLFIRICRDVADSTSPAVEEEMFRLTDLFKAARR